MEASTILTASHVLDFGNDNLAKEPSFGGVGWPMNWGGSCPWELSQFVQCAPDPETSETKAWLNLVCAAWSPPGLAEKVWVSHHLRLT